MTHSHGEQCRQIEWFGPLRFLTLPWSCSITTRSGTRLRKRTRADCCLLSFHTGLTQPRQRANQKKNIHSILHPYGELYGVINEIVWPFLRSSITITGSIFSFIGLLQLAFTLRYDQSLLHYLPFDEGRADCMQAAPPLEP